MNISRELIISLAVKAGAKIDCGTICFNEKDIDDFLMRFAELLTSTDVQEGSTEKQRDTLVNSIFMDAIDALEYTYEEQYQKVIEIINIAFNRMKGIS